MKPLVRLRELPKSLIRICPERREKGIDDGHFLMTRVPQETWANLPADRHGQGCNVSFADGHAEHWKWKTAKGPATSGSAGDKADSQALQAVALQ